MKQTLKFLDYLKSKRNFIIFWFCFHGFALFVNVFKIEGNINEHTNGAENYSEVHLFSTYYDRGDNGFWPFVRFFETEHTVDGTYTHEFFNGIFYKYDISEFIFYSFLILIILYVLWNSKYKPNNNY